MTKEEYQEYEKAVEYTTSDYRFWSSGYCPGCPECERNYGAIEEGENYPEVEGNFSWRPCEICGSHLCDDGYPAHCVDNDGEILHWEICTDCVYYLEYGRLDDMTMLEIDDS